jgi:hypothetical protein
MVLVLIGMCSIGVAQVDVTFPWTQPGSYSGNAINFGAVPVGQTKTAAYTFKILETSETSATVTIVRPNPPFGSDAPIEPFTLAPGQSITFNVTFTPPAVGDYTGYFTITARGGRPLVTKRQTVTLTGEGVSSGYQGQTTTPTPSPTPTWPIPVTTSPSDVTEDVAKLEAKLDALEPAIRDLRQRLDMLGLLLGELLSGEGFNLYPWHTEVPTTKPNIMGMLAQLEAKLDRLAQRPSEATAPDINITIIEIYNIIVEINQFILIFGGNVDKLEAKLDQLDTDLVDFWLDFMDMWDDLIDMWTEMIDRFDDVEDAVAANTRAINALQASNARIEDKLNQLLGLPAMARTTLITLTVSPAVISATDHTATLEGLPGAVEGGATINVYWSGIDNWRPGVTDPFWFDSVTANADGSFSLSKGGWGNSWPVWCEVTQTNAKGESAPVRVYNSTVMIAM